MPIPRTSLSRLRVFAIVVFGILLTSQLSFGYRGRWLSPSDWHINFGTLPAGKAATLPEVLTNTGYYPITLSAASISGAGFKLATPSLPLVLSPGQSVTFGVSFAPTNGNDYSGNLAITWGRYGRVMNVAVVGIGDGVGSTTVAPASLSFGNVAVGSSVTKTATIAATGEPAVISAITTTNPEFTVSGVSLPLTVNAGQSISFSVKFTPQSTGAANASLSFVNSGAGTQASQSLSGVGSAATPASAAHAVSLSWQDGPTNVTGYNVYRGTNSGGPYTKVNAALDPSNAYTDKGVKAGTNYFYVVTSVQGTGSESAYSNEVMAIVPNP
jgi:hypothetical protein